MIELIGELEVASYTSRHDAGEGEAKTRFLLRPLSARQKTVIQGKIDALPEAEQDAGMYEWALRFGLVGWENAPIAFDGADMDRMLDALPHAVYIELGNEIFRRSELTADDKKKSSSRSG